MSEFEDGVFRLPDGRDVAWRMWGPPGLPVVLRIQGTPSSRVRRHPDPTLRERLGVRYLTADRPGYGGSSRKPGRGIADIAGDYAALLDFHGLDRVPATGQSGGGPHVLALAARCPERVSAVSVIVGGAPLMPAEVERMVGINRDGYAAAEKGWQALYEFLVPMREKLLREGMRATLADAPPEDLALLQDPELARINAEDVAEALRQGAEGWTDESMAMHGEWDFDPGEIRCSVAWWHGDDDANAPLSAAQRAAARIPAGRFNVWRQEGHFASVRHTEEILRELLTRAG